MITLLILILSSASGLIALQNLSPGTPGLLLQAFAAGLVPMFIKNILEEFAWRGSLAPRVYSLGLNDYLGHSIVGLVWGTWHIPYFLFFVDRADIRSYTTLGLTAFIPLAIVAMISWAIVYGEIRLLTDSVWPVVLMHLIEDAFAAELLLQGFVKIVPGMDWLISPAVGIVSIISFAVVGIGLRRLRTRKQLCVRRIL